MAFDAELADRARELFRGRAGFSERKMFGGLCFLINGNMAGGVLGSDLIVRLGKADYEQALTEPHCRTMEMPGKAGEGRPMTGLLLVARAGTKQDEDLRRWLEAGIDFAASLPAK